MGIIEKFTPAAAAAMHAARQQRGEIGFAAINRIHQPVALGVDAAAARHRAARPGAARHFADLGLLAATATAALLANAVVCGVLSNPHDRYGARLVWIAPLVVTLLLCRLYARARPVAGRAAPRLQLAAVRPDATGVQPSAALLFPPQRQCYKAALAPGSTCVSPLSRL